MTDARDLGRWALVGGEPAGRFLLERWRIRPDFPLAACCDVSGMRTPPAGLKLVADWKRLLHDDELAGVILTVPWNLRSRMIRSALAARKRVLVEGSLGSVRGGAPSADVGVFQTRRDDHDFLAALAAAKSGRLGELHTIRWTSCELGLPRDGDDWTGVLRDSGPYVFHQLQQLDPRPAVRVMAWSNPPTDGFQVRLEHEGGLSVWIDLQRKALCGLQTGWVLEGTGGAYRRRRLMTLAPDGEILQEDLAPADEADEFDVFAELRRLAGSRQQTRESLVRAMRGATIAEAIRRSVQTRRTAPVRSLPDLAGDAAHWPVQTAE